MSDTSCAHPRSFHRALLAKRVAEKKEKAAHLKAAHKKLVYFADLLCHNDLTTLHQGLCMKAPSSCCLCLSVILCGCSVCYTYSHAFYLSIIISDDALRNVCIDYGDGYGAKTAGTAPPARAGVAEPVRRTRSPWIASASSYVFVPVEVPDSSFCFGRDMFRLLGCCCFTVSPFRKMVLSVSG